MAAGRMQTTNGGRGGDSEESLSPGGLSLRADLAQFQDVIAQVDCHVRYARHAQSGRQAVIILVTAREGERVERYVLKVFTRATDLDVREYTNLRLFSRRLRELGACVHCPKPLLGGDSYYLMSYVDAPTLDEWLAYGPHDRWESMAALIVLALQVYHDTISEVYGECHPRHIFVQENNSLCFIDCTIPRHHVDATHMQAYSLLARDIGYWLHDTMSRSLRGILYPDMRSLTLLRFTRVLVDQAAERSPRTRREFVDEVLAVLRARRQRSARGLRLRMSATMLLSRLILAGPRRGRSS